MTEHMNEDEAKQTLQLMQRDRLYEFPLTTERFSDVQLGTGVDLTQPWAPIQRDGIPAALAPVKPGSNGMLRDPARIALRWFQASSSFQQKMLSSIGIKIKAPFFNFGLSEQTESERKNAKEDIYLAYDVIVHSERLPESEAEKVLESVSGLRAIGSHYVEQLFYGFRIVAAIHGSQTAIENRHSFEMAVKVAAWFYSAEANVKEKMFSQFANKNLEVQVVITGRLDPAEAAIVTSSDDLAHLLLGLRSNAVRIEPVPIFATLRSVRSIQSSLSAAFEKEFIHGISAIANTKDSS